MDVTFIQFMFYGIGCFVAPRLTLAVFVLDFASGKAAIGLSILCIWAAWKSRKGFTKGITTIVNAAHSAVTGRQLIVEKVVEKVVEKKVKVEKIVERTKTILVKVPINQLTWEDAFSCLRSKPGASRDELALGYREMIQRVHPDKGGSAYLASMVNQAKTMLLSKGS